MAHAPRKRANPHDPTTAAVNVRRSWPRWSSTLLFDHLGRLQQQRRRNRQAERLGGLQ